ncbi:MAG: hypothetical protein ACLU9S_02040 [Oscillospiraceae bacterium]
MAEDEDIKNLSAGFYTFSAYVNTGGTSVSGRGVVVDIEPKTSTGANAGWTCSESVTSTGVDEWKRIRVTALIPEGYTARILIGFIDKSCIGTVWFDDLQFEKTENANTASNLLENTNFKNGTTNWNVGGSLAYIRGHGQPAPPWRQRFENEWNAVPECEFLYPHSSRR